MKNEYIQGHKRGLAYKRYQREKHIMRKENLLRRMRSDNPPHYYNDRDMWSNIGGAAAHKEEGSWQPTWIVSCRGHLDKGKIHCGCGACSSKTRNKGYKRRHVYGNYDPNINYKYSDLKKIQSMECELLNYT